MIGPRSNNERIVDPFQRNQVVYCVNPHIIRLCIYSICVFSIVEMLWWKFPITRFIFLMQLLIGWKRSGSTRTDGIGYGVFVLFRQERLGLCVLLASDEDKFVAKTAFRTSGWDEQRIIDSLHRQTHAKVLEYVVEFFTYSEALMNRSFPVWTSMREQLSSLPVEHRVRHVRRSKKSSTIVYPDILHALREMSSVHQKWSPEWNRPKNAACSSFCREQSQRENIGCWSRPQYGYDISAEVSAFLREERYLFKTALVILFDMFQLDDVEATSDFTFDFSDIDGFDFDVDGDCQKKPLNRWRKNPWDVDWSSDQVGIQGEQGSARHSIEMPTKRLQRSSNPVGYRIPKLFSYAGNRNLCDDVIREIARNKELHVNILFRLHWLPIPRL